MTDSIIDIINLEKSLVDSHKIINRIYHRDFYKLVQTKKDIKLIDKELLKDKNIIMNKINLNLSKGDCNPIEYVSFFNKDNLSKKFNVKAEDVSGLVPKYCNETIIRLYHK